MCAERFLKETDIVDFGTNDRQNLFSFRGGLDIHLNDNLFIRLTMMQETKNNVLVLSTTFFCLKNPRHT